MLEVIKHIKRIQTAGFVVIVWSVFMFLMTLFIMEKQPEYLSLTSLILGLIELGILFVSATAVISKRYSFLVVIMIILVIDFIGTIAIGITGGVAIVFRIIVISFVISGLRSSILLKNSSNFFSDPQIKSRIEPSPRLNRQHNTEKEKTFKGERNRTDFDTAEEYYIYIFELEGEPTIQSIKNNYKKVIKRNHPDKFEHLGERYRLMAEAKTKIVNEAMEYFKKKYNFN